MAVPDFIIGKVEILPQLPRNALRDVVPGADSLDIRRMVQKVVLGGSQIQEAE